MSLTSRAAAAAAAGAAAGGGGAGAEAEAGIVLDAARRRFQTPDGKAYLDYQEVAGGGDGKGKGKAALELVHTYVPPSKRGGGVAGKLCRAACAYARERDLRIIPTCTYVSETFLPRNPEWMDLALTDTSPQSESISQRQ